MSDNWMKWIVGGLFGAIPATAGIVTYSSMRARRKSVLLSALSAGGVLAGLGGLTAYLGYRMSLPTAEATGTQLAVEHSTSGFMQEQTGTAGVYLPRGGGLPRSLDTQRAMAGLGQYVPRNIRSGWGR